MKCLISIIVPIYNTEKYLHRCIDSVLAQTYKDFELLLIDDGSTDSSGVICDSYAAKDGHIKVFHKENGGVSSARNLGLDNAQGEWITFVDSDDYIEENFLKSFEGNLDADLVVGNAVLLTCQTGRRTDLKCISSGCYKDVRNVFSSHLSEMILRVPWGKMYRAGLISDLRFNESMHLGEDTLFSLCYFRRIKSISVLGDENDNSSYVYRGPESAIKKYEMPVKVSASYLTQIGEAYDTLNIGCEEFEDSIVWFFHECCAKDIPAHGALWYENDVIKKLCLRRSARMGIFLWIKTWLMFHGFYRLKLYMLNRRSR